MDEGEPEPTEYPMRLGMVFAHTPTYPEEAPFVKLHSVSGLGEDDLAAARALVAEKVEEFLGMAMIFELINELKEWLREWVASGKVGEVAVGAADPAAAGGLTPEQAKLQAQLAEEARVREARAAGTPVTPESFAAWRAVFDQEMAEKAKASGEQAQESSALTGRAWFQQNWNEKNRAKVEEDAEAVEGLEADESGAAAEDELLAELEDLDEEDLEGLLSDEDD